MKVEGTCEKRPLTAEQRKLCGEYMNMAASIASKRRHNYISSEDRLQDAYVGLIGAARDYDPSQGVAFATYAYRRILGAIIDGERERGSLIKTPRHCKSMRCYAAIGCDRESDYASGRMLQAIAQMSVARETPSDLDVRDAIETALQCLSDRDRRIAELYYLRGKTMAQVAREMGYTESRVSQLLPSILHRLRTHSALVDYSSVKPSATSAVRSYKPWTAEEDAQLTACYGVRPLSTLASQLGRSESAIYTRANTLGLYARRQEVA